MPTLSKVEFDFIRKLVSDHSANVLDEDKAYLGESRLVSVARRGGFSTIEGLVRELRRKSFSGIHQQVIEAMMTTETHFFRDGHPFELLRKSVIPEILKHQGNTAEIRIWSAACASGQEPYSIAMVLDKYFIDHHPIPKINILASDLSKAMLQRAQKGIYSQHELDRGLPGKFKEKYFSKHSDKWQINLTIRRMVAFENVNLAHHWSSIPAMDILFLRNVMIYFDIETKKSILDKARQILNPGGYLFLGSSEAIVNLDDSFEKIQAYDSRCYRVLK